ncbi:MAG: response regulator receiver [Syntrophaceae bacterium]|nr:MAG: response regulator receiver [Syntrophaceae bacterium]
MNPLKPAILCVDDEEANRKLLEKLLVPRGYVVVSAADGKEALLKIKSQAIDLVLLDIIMPGMNGFEVCRQIKEDQKFRNIPVIMITASILKQDRIRGIEAGAEEFLSKPFDLEEVLARIKMLLKMKALDDERKNAESQKEAALAALQKSHDELERRVRERTAELAQANETLQADIIERKQAEEKLLESKILFEAVVENIPLMIFLKESTDLRFVIFNRAGEELLGYDRKDLLGKNNLDLFPPAQAIHFMAKDREVLNGEAIVMDIPEEQIQTAKKGQRVLHTKKVCIRSADGATKYLLGISEDITERKYAEEELQQTLESLRKSFGATIQVMVSAVESRDPYTAGHQVRSANLACAIATEMELPQDTIEGLRMAGSIHDIGKLSIPAEILSKPTQLSELEFSLIKEHARTGHEMLKDVESPWPLAEIVYQHHERMDGSGYPRHLKGEEICMEARIMAVADVVEAMASHRPYRPGLGIDAALNEIEKNKGTIYDEAVVDACLKLFREKEFKLEGA